MRSQAELGTEGKADRVGRPFQAVPSVARGETVLQTEASLEFRTQPEQILRRVEIVQNARVGNGDFENPIGIGSQDLIESLIRRETKDLLGEAPREDRRMPALAVVHRHRDL